MKIRFLFITIMAGHFVVCHSQSLTIAMTGDVMMGTTYPTVRLPQHDGRQLFKDCRRILRYADVAVGNLEGTLCDEATISSKEEDNPNKYAFRTPVAYASLLSDAGFDFMSMANNHAFDFGWKGIQSTEQALRRQGIRFAGIAGRSESTIINRRGLRIGLCAFGHNGYTVCHLDLENVRRTLVSLKEKTDLIIVSFHGGAEGVSQSHLPYGMEHFLKEKRGDLRTLAHFCIDHGADVVYGHGPHVVRAIEVYKGRFIGYSLGNFCTPFGISLKGVASYAPVIEVTVDRAGRFQKGTIHSFIQYYGLGPRRDKTHKVARHIRALTESDIPANRLAIDRQGRITLR